MNVTLTRLKQEIDCYFMKESDFIVNGRWYSGSYILRLRGESARLQLVRKVTEGPIFDIKRSTML